MMRRRAARGRLVAGARPLIVGLLVVIACACGSPSAPNPPGPPPTPTITFTSENDTPGADSISVRVQFSNIDEITLTLTATSVTDLFGYGVDFVYDPAIVAFDSSTPGTLLDGAGITVNSQITEPTPGTLVIGQTRVGGVPGVSGTGVLITLTFKAVGPGLSTILLQNGGAFDSTAAPIMMNFFGGAVVVPVTAE